MRKVKYISLLLGLFFALNVHAAQVKPTDKGIAIVDDSGYELVLERPAQRILALYSPLNHILLELNLGHTLIGRSFADAEVEGLRHLPAVGTVARVIPERIFELKPDVVIQYMGESAPMALGLGLRKLGVPVLLFRLQNFEDVFSAMEKIGKASGTQAHVDEIVKGLANRIGNLRNILMDLPRVSAFYELRYPHLLTIGSGTFAADILHVAGASNVISSAERVLRIDDAEILSKNPEAYIIQEGTLNVDPVPMDERPNFAQLQAVKNQRVLIVAESEFTSLGRVAVEAAEKLARWLHPHVDFSIQVPPTTVR